MIIILVQELYDTNAPKLGQICLIFEVSELHTKIPGDVFASK